MPARRVGREQALQALYAVGVGSRDPAEAIDEIVGETSSAEHRAFVRELVLSTIEFTPEADRVITPLLESWTIERLPVVDRCILRMATFELCRRPELSPAIVINEAVELAKRFSTEDSGRFINGVLSAVVRTHASP